MKTSQTCLSTQPSQPSPYFYRLVLVVTLRPQIKPIWTSLMSVTINKTMLDVLRKNTRCHNTKDSNTYRIKTDALLNGALGVFTYLCHIIQESTVRYGKWAMIESLQISRTKGSHKSECMKLEQSIFPWLIDHSSAAEQTKSSDLRPLKWMTALQGNVSLHIKPTVFWKIHLSYCDWGEHFKRTKMCHSKSENYEAVSYSSKPVGFLFPGDHSYFKPGQMSHFGSK